MLALWLFICTQIMKEMLKFTRSLPHLGLIIVLIIWKHDYTKAWRLSGSRKVWNMDTWRLPLDITTATAIPPITEYAGPRSTLDNMEVGWGLEEYGINILVGPSVSAEGKGLFVSLQEDVEEATIPQGTVLCGYSQGNFTHSADGDKTVGYQFSCPTVLIVFNKQLMPIYDAVMQIANQTSNLTRAVAGHILEIDSASKDQTKMDLYPDPSNKHFPYYFVPFAPDQITIMNAAMFANDLAYTPQISPKEYHDISSEKNLLMLTWRVEFDGQSLVPSWPVVITQSDLLLRSHEPQEVGVKYSWNYWDAYRKQGKLV